MSHIGYNPQWVVSITQLSSNPSLNKYFELSDVIICYINFLI